MMKLFLLRKRRQSGYCTIIAEPVSDLAPEVISAIKASSPEVRTTDSRKKILSPFQDSKEFDEITESITLTPTPSESSSPIPPSSILGPALRELDEVNNKINARSKVVARSHLHTKSAHKVGTPDLKTPITFSIHDIEREVERQKIRGLSDCRTTPDTTKSFDVTADQATDAPTERISLFNLERTSRTHKNDEVGLNRISIENVGAKKDLNMSFDPDIQSVYSDITEPTYETLDANKTCQHEWKKLQQGKLNLTKLLGSGEKSPESIFDFLIDTLCQHPIDENNGNA